MAAKAHSATAVLVGASAAQVAVSFVAIGLALAGAGTAGTLAETHGTD